MLALAAILAGTHWVNAAFGSQANRQSSPPLEKKSRTLAQQKIDSQLLNEIYRRRGLAAQKNVPPGKTRVKIDEKHRALVDVRADVTPELQKKVSALKGTIVSTSRQYRSIIAWIPLLKLEQLAQDRRITAISPPADMALR